MTWRMVSIGSLSLEGRTPGQHFIEDGPQRVHVGRRADLAGVSPSLLRGHVAGRAHDLAGLGVHVVGFQPLGQPEVGDLQHAVIGEQDVRRLQVAVDDARLVRFADRQNQRLQQLG